MITITPVALVRNTIEDFNFSRWDEIHSEIKLIKPFDESYLEKLKVESMVQIIYHFHRANRYQPSKDNKDVFARRDSPRPNNLAVSIVVLKRISDDVLVVQGLDAINGTPVFDIKPFGKEDLP